MFKIFQLQPAFTIDVPVEQKQAIERLKMAIARDELRGLAESAGSVFDFKIARAERRFWSPHLSAQFSETDSGVKLFARFSPRPEVWTMFIAIYFIVAILMGLAMIVGYVQWTLGYSPWSLAVVPMGAFLIACLHLASMIGQSLSADQMALLRERLDRSIEIAFGEQSGDLLASGSSGDLK
ncbi:MAG: hypothetical protein ACF8CQ_20560 [Rhodopirellula sp. JB044]|uniref:hypothetical protein n=1 Tax=Rhodopirellula sp. JB044 TaxID=3342844 RepID=UPI00370C1C17